MFPTRTLLCTGMILCTGCSAIGPRVFYYDRNADGKVDLETHHYPRTEDADWELRDNDFDGRYEKRILFGVGVKTSPVDRPVPTGVRMEKR